MERRDSFFCNPQPGPTSTTRSSPPPPPPTKKSRLENTPGGEGERVAKQNQAIKVANALDLLAQAAKDCTLVFERRELPLHKVIETAKTTESAAKQSQPNVAEPSGAVADGIGIPREKIQGIRQQEQCEIAERTRTMSDSDDLSLNIPRIKFKSKASKEVKDLVDFRGLAMLPRHHALLLKKECIDHPYLAACSGRTRRWLQFAYETLGELLFFLRSTRVGEMTGKKRAHLKRLWKDACGLGFNLSWLEPGVRFGLESRSYLEQQRDTVATLEREKRRLDKERDTLHCQLSTLTMLLCENKRGRASLDLLVQRAKDNVKSAEETFLY